MKLVVTIPAQNEEKTIAQVISGVPRNIPGISETEVVVVNDGSTDRTAEIARRAGAIVVNLMGRPGLGYVFKAGLERAMRRGADIICNIDGDGQFNPEDIRELLKPIQRDEADFVTCSRFAKAEYRPTMPGVKFWGNRAVTRIINWVCGGTKFTDVSCGFRAFNREAAYRLTLFGRYTYTQECFIDLFGKGVRMTEVPLRVRGVREHGKSRVASSITKYVRGSLPIILRAMRDIQPLKFFGGIGMLFFLPGLLAGIFVAIWYAIGDTKTEVVNGVKHAVVVHGTAPFTSLIPIGGALVIMAFIMFAIALLADMMARHRRISEELLYLARRRIYSSRRTQRAVLAVEEHPHDTMAPTLHDSWTVPSLPIMKSIPKEPAVIEDPQEEPTASATPR